MARDALERWLSPRIVLIVVGLVIAAAYMFTPRNYMADAAPSLTSYSVDPAGVRGLWEILHRLGWPVQRRLVPFAEPLDTSAIYVVLEPPLPLTTHEVHVLLDAVRRGAGALVVPAPGSALADSLHLEQSSVSYPYAIVDTTRHRGATTGDTTAATPDEDGRVASVGTGTLDALWHYLRRTAPLPAGAVTFVAVHDLKQRVQPAVLGVPVGRGRLVAVADPRIFRNRIVRRGDAAVLDTRLVEWLTRSPGTVLVFDEYHQGFGDHGSLRRAIAHAMLGTPPGRMLTQALVAALVLLAALGIRAIPPSPRARAERRSPIEHADALGHAYEQIGATRTATRRLVRGLRRRHPFALPRADDDAFLDAVRARHPSLADDVELVRRAMQQPIAPDAFVAVGLAINHMERMLAS